MSSLTGLRFLRPKLVLGKDVSAVRKSAYLSFFHTTSRSLRKVEKQEDDATTMRDAGVRIRGDVKERVKELQMADALVWPRIKRWKGAVSVREFLERYKGLEAGERNGDTCVIRGIYLYLGSEIKNILLINGQGECWPLEVRVRNLFF